MLGSMDNPAPLLVLTICAVLSACTADSPGDGETSDETSGDTEDTDATDTEGTDTEGTNDGQLTLDTCDEVVSPDAAAFYQQHFACVDVSPSGTGTLIETDGLPPHPSAYYPEDHPNWVAFDDRGGTHMKNPGEIGAASYAITVPDTPVAKGITINAMLVDNTMNTSNEEYFGGPVGVALNGVVIFAAMAAPGDVLAQEAFTFDNYEGHPAGGTYHYHFKTPGPLEVLEAFGLANSSVPGEASVELYGIMCDGAVVLGCTELDGGEPNTGDFDAQNGHVHDIADADQTHFSSRYHTHVCPSKWPDYPFFPEIAYYETSGCPTPGPPGMP